MDEASLDELAQSIREQGIMQPILVRPVDGGRFEIIAGERRWRAAQRAGLNEIPALVHAVPDQAALALALIENIQREDLNPLEEAQGLQRLIDEFGLTHDAAAKAVGRSRSAVTNLLRLRELAKPVQEYLLAGAARHGPCARAARARGGAADGGRGARRRAGTVGARDRAARPSPRAPGQARTRSAARAARDPDLARLAEELAEALGAKVSIEPRKGGAGRLVIAYSSLEQLDGIIARLRCRRATVDGGAARGARLSRAASASSRRRRLRTCPAPRR